MRRTASWQSLPQNVFVWCRELYPLGGQFWLLSDSSRKRKGMHAGQPKLLPFGKCHFLAHGQNQANPHSAKVFRRISLMSQNNPAGGASGAAQWPLGFTLMIRWIVFDDEKAEAVVSRFKRGAAEIRQGQPPQRLARANRQQLKG
jgi:hypothetical protein